MRMRKTGVRLFFAPFAYPPRTLRSKAFLDRTLFGGQSGGSAFVRNHDSHERASSGTIDIVSRSVCRMTTNSHRAPRARDFPRPPARFPRIQGRIGLNYILNPPPRIRPYRPPRRVVPPRRDRRLKPVRVADGNRDLSRP